MLKQKMSERAWIVSIKVKNLKGNNDWTPQQEVKLLYERREREKSRVRVIQMENLRAMIWVKRSDRIRNERVVDVRKGVDEIINENTMR